MFYCNATTPYTREIFLLLQDIYLLPILLEDSSVNKLKANWHRMSEFDRPHLPNFPDPLPYRLPLSEPDRPLTPSDRSPDASDRTKSHTAEFTPTQPPAVPAERVVARHPPEEPESAGKPPETSSEEKPTEPDDFFATECPPLPDWPEEPEGPEKEQDRAAPKLPPRVPVEIVHTDTHYIVANRTLPDATLVDRVVEKLEKVSPLRGARLHQITRINNIV